MFDKLSNYEKIKLNENLQKNEYNKILLHIFPPEYYYKFLIQINLFGDFWDHGENYRKFALLLQKSVAKQLIGNVLCFKYPQLVVNKNDIEDIVVSWIQKEEDQIIYKKIQELSNQFKPNFIDNFLEILKKKLFTKKIRNKLFKQKEEKNDLQKSIKEKYFREIFEDEKISIDIQSNQLLSQKNAEKQLLQVKGEDQQECEIKKPISYSQIPSISQNRDENSFIITIKTNEETENQNIDQIQKIVNKMNKISEKEIINIKQIVFEEEYEKLFQIQWNKNFKLKDIFDNDKFEEILSEIAENEKEQIRKFLLQMKEKLGKESSSILEEQNYEQFLKFNFSNLNKKLKNLEKQLKKKEGKNQPIKKKKKKLNIDKEIQMISHLRTIDLKQNNNQENDQNLAIKNELNQKDTFFNQQQNENQQKGIQQFIFSQEKSDSESNLIKNDYQNLELNKLKLEPMKQFQSEENQPNFQKIKQNEFEQNKEKQYFEFEKSSQFFQKNKKQLEESNQNIPYQFYNYQNQIQKSPTESFIQKQNQNKIFEQNSQKELNFQNLFQVQENSKQNLNQNLNKSYYSSSNQSQNSKQNFFCLNQEQDDDNFRFNRFISQENQDQIQQNKNSFDFFTNFQPKEIPQNPFIQIQQKKATQNPFLEQTNNPNIKPIFFNNYHQDRELSEQEKNSLKNSPKFKNNSTFQEMFYSQSEKSKKNQLIYNINVRILRH